MPGMTVDRVRVMISSRTKPYKAEDGSSFDLGSLRAQLKDAIDGARLFEEQIFDCWMNEHEPAKAADQDLWDECVAEVRRAHVVLVLYNGDAGWVGNDAGIGICQAELQAALLSGRARTRVIQVPSAAVLGARHEHYRALVAREQLFTGAPAATIEDALTVARKALVEVVTKQSRVGGSVLRRDALALGQALEWSKLDFAARSDVMRRACATAVRSAWTAIAPGSSDDTSIAIDFLGARVLLCLHAIPAAASVAAAREMVGKPHLRDHLRIDGTADVEGPVHVITCFKSATEKQATDLLGFPDATVVATTFGIYLVDDVQKVQACLLSNCRDTTSTGFAVQRLHDWLTQSGEDAALLARGRSRRRIVEAIRKEQGLGAPSVGSRRRMANRTK